MKEFDLTPAVQAMLDRAFRMHPDTQDQTLRMEAIKEKATQFARYLMRHTPQGCEEQKEVVRCIREATFWASEAIRKNEL